MVITVLLIELWIIVIDFKVTSLNALSLHAPWEAGKANTYKTRGEEEGKRK